MRRRLAVATLLVLPFLLLASVVFSATPNPVPQSRNTTPVATSANTPAPAPATRPVNPTLTPPLPTWWHPAVVTSWYWQLSGTVGATHPESVFDIDGFDTTAAFVTSLHSADKKAICYISAGTYENWRPDASQFPAAALGNNNGWPGEKWLDIRATAIQPIMAARMDMCVSKGFDGLEPDNVDGYANRSGFPLKAADQITYNTWLANTAHAKGLAVFLKNDTDQVAQLQPSFDGAISEQCAQYSECASYAPFVTAGKPVLAAEYSGTQSTRCATLNAANFNGAYASINLDGSRWIDCR